MSISYTYRPSALEKEKTYTLEQQQFTIKQSERVDTVKYAEIKGIRLYYAPSQFADNNYHCDITLKNGANTLIKSVHYIAPAEFEDRGEAYKEFVSAMHACLVDYGNIAFTSGNKAGCFSLNIIITVASAIFVGWALSYFAEATDLELVIDVFIFIGMLYAGLKYLKKNRPKKYSPANIPPEMLP
ncbi:MAG: hypothetical protein AAGC88_14515 [Bacteroidota bacterium]